MKSIVGGSARRAVKTGSTCWPGTSLISRPGKKSTLLLPVVGEEMVWTTADNKDAARGVGL